MTDDRFKPFVDDDKEDDDDGVAFVAEIGEENNAEASCCSASS